MSLMQSTDLHVWPDDVLECVVEPSSLTGSNTVVIAFKVDVATSLVTLFVHGENIDEVLDRVARWGATIQGFALAEAKNRQRKKGAHL